MGRFAIADERPRLSPDYDRGIRMLSDEELEAEILGGKGDAGYKLALLAEADRRGQAPPPAPEGRRRAPAFDADELD